MSGRVLQFKSFEFTWKITNFSQKKLENERIISQTFPADCEGDVKFTLHFYPRGDVQSGETEVSNGGKWTSEIFLSSYSNKTYDTSFHFELSVLDANGEKFGSCHSHEKISIGFGFPEIILVTDLENQSNNLLPDDTLTIFCRVEETKTESEE